MPFYLYETWVRGHRLAFHDTGGYLPTLILLHAFPLRGDMWSGQAAALAKDFRVIAPDLPGHGHSAAPDHPYAMDEMAAEVLALASAMRLHDFVVGGLSMGGYVAFALWRKAANRIRGLILSDTRAEADTEDGKKGRCEMAAAVKNGGAGTIVEKLLPRLLGKSTHSTRPAVVSAVRTMIQAASPIGTANALLGMADRPDSTPDLARIRCPTLVLVGEEDELTPPASAQKIADCIPGAKLARIPGAGHLANLEAPEAWTEAARAFLPGAFATPLRI